ncbi:MAG: MTAP family purine nucleoside phosphorylase [Candidatus Aquicultorales bacterium]
MADVPSAEYAIIGGSSTNSTDFPATFAGVELLKDALVFETPYGNSPEFTLFAMDGKVTLTCRMHGWRKGVARADASRQIFWVLREAGVTRILGEGGVGAVDPKLQLRDIVVPDDYIDFSSRRDVSLDSGFLLVMRDALCGEQRAALMEAARAHAPGNVIEHGVYCVTDGKHFESPAEVRAYKMLGADIIGQSLCPEVYLAREIGACYASMQLVVNYAEGVVPEWSHEEFAAIFYGESATVGKILLEALQTLPEKKSCSCLELRKQTLLR